MPRSGQGSNWPVLIEPQSIGTVNCIFSPLRLKIFWLKSKKNHSPKVDTTGLLRDGPPCKLSSVRLEQKLHVVYVDAWDPDHQRRIPMGRSGGGRAGKSAAGSKMASKRPSRSPSTDGLARNKVGAKKSCWVGGCALVISHCLPHGVWLCTGPHSKPFSSYVQAPTPVPPSGSNPRSGSRGSHRTRFARIRARALALELLPATLSSSIMRNTPKRHLLAHVHPLTHLCAACLAQLLQ